MRSGITAIPLLTFLALGGSCGDNHGAPSLDGPTGDSSPPDSVPDQCPVDTCCSPLRACTGSVGFYTQEGDPAFVQPTIAWFLQWSTDAGHPRFLALRTFNEVYYRGTLVEVNVPVNDGVDIGGCFDPAEVAALWAKIPGYAPVVSFPVTCDMQPIHQVVEPLTPEEEASEICPDDLGQVVCVTGTLVDSSGSPVAGEGYVFSSGGFGHIGGPYVEWALDPEDVTDGHFQTEPGTIVFLQPGFLPQIHCLPCGEYTFQLDESPYAWSGQ